jgi:tight adherence protein B
MFGRWTPRTRKSRGPTLDEQLDEAARALLIAAAVMEAGLTPARAAEWGGLSAERLATPTPVWRLCRVVWETALGMGAAPAITLRHLAGVLGESADAARSDRASAAGPAAATRLVMALPAVGMGLGWLMGFNTLPFLFGTVVGALLVACAGALLYIGVRWSARLVRLATLPTWSAGLTAELMAMALRAGSSVARARELAAQIPASGEVERVRLERERASCAALSALADHSGVSLAGLLRAQAQLERSTARAQAREASARLPVRLLVPLGACVLPAFIAVGVLPPVAVLISSTVRG